LMRSGVLARLDLDRFSESDVAALIERLAATAPPPGLAAAVVARTEGVPLYVVEVVRTLLAGGPFEMRPTAAKAQFRGSDVGGRGQTSGAIDVPPNVRLAVAYQLETLSCTGRELLALAASFGREFRFEALMRAAELDPTRILDLLGQAIAARILTEVPD